MPWRASVSRLMFFVDAWAGSGIIQLPNYSGGIKLAANLSGQISSRPHTIKIPKWWRKVREMGPRLFQGNLGEGGEILL